MKYLKEESVVDYESYSFNYRLWAIPENSEDISFLYQSGYLPYSGSEKQLPLYYLCRSSRVCLQDFSLSSENRRVMRKISEAGITLIPKKFSGKEVLDNTEVCDFFLSYFSQKHGKGIMNQERLVSILNYSHQIFTYCYYHHERLIAVVITQESEDFCHYWFSAYDMEARIPLGVGLMIAFAEQQKQVGMKYLYLGTLYGSKSLYKTNLEPLEYFDGNGWVNDMKALKKLLSVQNLRVSQVCDINTPNSFD